MKTSIIKIIQKINDTCCKPYKLGRSQKHPKNLVRLCRRLSEFKTIVNESLHTTNKEWDKRIINKVVEHVLEGYSDSPRISVYSSDNLDSFDLGHALAVIAESISGDKFRSYSKRRDSHCSRGSLIIPTDSLPESVSYEFTPKGNLNFFPANNYHFDLTINDYEEFAIAILDGIRSQAIRWSFICNEKKFQGSYLLQAGIVYSSCLRSFGVLDSNFPPACWNDGIDLDAAEQIDTLKHLAKVSIINSPT